MLHELQEPVENGKRLGKVFSCCLGYRVSVGYKADETDKRTCPAVPVHYEVLTSALALISWCLLLSLANGLHRRIVASVVAFHGSPSLTRGSELETHYLCDCKAIV